MGLLLAFHVTCGHPTQFDLASLALLTAPRAVHAIASRPQKAGLVTCPPGKLPCAWLRANSLARTASSYAKQKGRKMLPSGG